MYDTVNRDQFQYLIRFFQKQMYSPQVSLTWSMSHCIAGNKQELGPGA